MDSRADDVLKLHETLQAERLPYEQHWREVAERVLPEYRAINENEKIEVGQKRNEKVFDSTARLALDRFAAAIESITVPRSQVWHELTVPKGAEELKNSVEVKRWLQATNDVLFAMRYAPSANFASQAHAKIINLGAFGTGGLFIDEVVGSGIRYLALHIGELYFCNDHAGRVDIVHRQFEYSARKAAQRFGEYKLPEKIRDALNRNDPKKFQFIHCVRPNDDLQYGRSDARGMKYASYYVSQDCREIVEEGGYRTMPYCVSRYMTAPRETYGRGPAMTILPDIKMVNEMEKTNLRILHRMGDPPLLLTEDGALSAFSTRPGALNPGALDSQGNPNVIAMQTNGRPDLVEAKLDKVRALINDAFLVTLFQILVDSPQITATEAMIRAQEKGALLAPVAGRIQTEWLGVQIERELDIAAAAGLLPPMPRELAEIGGEIDIEYLSPLSRAARAEEGAAIMRTVESVLPIAQIDPSVLDVFDWPTTVRELADVYGFPASALKTIEQVKALQEQRAQQQQQQQAMAMMQQGASARLDIAQAQQVAAG